VPLAVWLILGLLVLGLVVWLAARSGSREASQQRPARTPEPLWRSSARSAYSDVRWLYDELDVPLAIWRGESLFDPQAAMASSAASSHQATWSQIHERIDRARESLYRVEGAMPNTEVARLATRMLDEVTATRDAVDALADAHRRRRAAEADTSTDPSELESAQNVETAATTELASRRTRLNRAMLDFSAAT
jgi:hypothetical protein